jgi:PAS domain S-box-containing protein
MDSARHADFGTRDTLAPRADSSAPKPIAEAARAPAGLAQTGKAPPIDVPRAPAEAAVALARRVELQTVLYNLTDHLHRAETRVAIYDAAMDAMFEGLGCARASILLFEKHGPMKFVASRGLSETYRKDVEGHSPWTRADIDATPILVGDIEASNLGDALKDTIRCEDIAALGFFPLIADGQVIGKFMTYYNRPQDFAHDHTDLGVTIARQLGFAVSRIRGAEARERAEDNLRREQELLRTIIDRIPVMIALYTPDARVIDLNAEFQRAIGWSEREAADGSLLRELYPDQAYRAEVEDFMSAANGEWMDIRMKTRAGELRDTIWTNLRLSDGVQIGIGVDITERKRTEEALRRSTETERTRLLELEAVMDSVPAAIWVARDAACSVITGNRAAYALFREMPGANIAIAAQRERNLNFAAYVDGRPLAIDELPLRRAVRGENVRDLEVEYRFKDGTVRHMVANATPLRDAHGTVTGGVVAFIDVTDRKRARDVQEHLAAIVESSDDAIISKDANGIILSWNKGAQRLFGYSADEIVGKNILTIIPEHLRDEEPEILSRIRSGESIDHYETQRRRKDGTLVDISLTVSPMRNGRGEIVAASKIARDISDKKKAEAQHSLLMAELNHRVKNTLATVISIARQSFSGPEMREARAAFNSRIRGLAQSHSRLAEADWTSVDLKSLFEDEFAPYRQSGNVDVAGPPVALSPKCALTLGLAIHELATNAAKYGALSINKGCVEVRWTIDRNTDALTISWQERCGPPVVAPARSGFGRLLLERVVAADLKASVALSFQPEGAAFTAVIPSAQYRAQLA